MMEKHQCNDSVLWGTRTNTSNTFLVGGEWNGSQAGRCRCRMGEHMVGAKRMERVGRLACDWPHEIMTSLKSTDFKGQEQGVSLTLSFNTSNAPWEFQRVSPPFHPTMSNLVGMKNLFICFQIPTYNFAYICPLFKMKIPQVTMDFKIYCLRLTDTHREEEGHLRVEEFYFLFLFLCKGNLWSGFQGWCAHSQSL